MRYRAIQDTQTALQRTFEEHCVRLQWLAFLLTGDRGQSLRACSKALQLERAPNPVFAGFMTAWSRKLICAESLRAIRAELRESERRTRLSPDKADWPPPPVSTEITRAEFEQAVLAMDVFPRCAMLLTVFEKLSIEDAAILLDSDKELIQKAMVEALIELTQNIAAGRGWGPTRSPARAGSNSVLFGLFSHEPLPLT